MAKKRRRDSSEEAKEDHKKKKKKDAKKKRKESKKAKKEKKKPKKKEAKKGKRQASSSSSSGSSASVSEEKKAKQAKREADPDTGSSSEAAAEAGEEAPPPFTLELPPVEAGILRFQFAADETGPLGLRFSGGFPPMILAVNPDSFAEKKGIPPMHEVHKINGLALVPQNRDVVMSSLKARPVTLDVRPQGWKPADKVKELQLKKEREEAERLTRIEEETHRRELVAIEQREAAEKEAADKAVKEEADRREQEEQKRRALEAREKQRAKEQEFTRALEAEPPELRAAADALMEAQYGSGVSVKGRRGLPLRLLTRRKDVAWLWAGEVMELIGGGLNEPDDSWG